jgi:hypothetical protein
MHTRIVRKGNPEWVPTGETDGSVELCDADDLLLAYVFKTIQAEPKQRYRWEAWAGQDNLAGCGYAETEDLAKKYAENWLSERGSSFFSGY